jgi:hypothetical protein
VGEECVLTASADHAYGASGSPPVIPPNSTLAFTVECLSSGAPPAGVQAEEESWCQVARVRRGLCVSKHCVFANVLEGLFRSVSSCSGPLSNG